MVKNPDCVLFTIHIYADKLETLFKDHKAENAKIDIGSCACNVLAAHIRTLPPERLEYKALSNEKDRTEILRQLDAAAKRTAETYWI